MKFFIVYRGYVPLDETFATRIGAESFIKIVKGIDKVCKRKYIYEIEEIEVSIHPPKEK